MIMCDTRQGGEMVVDLNGTSMQLTVEMLVLITRYARSITPLIAIERACSEEEAERVLMVELFSGAVERLHDLRREREPPEPEQPEPERPKRRRRASGGSGCPAS